MSHHPRIIIRTAESICDDAEARLAVAKPRPVSDEPTGEEWARGFRDAVLFMVCAFLVIYGLLGVGGM